MHEAEHEARYTTQSGAESVAPNGAEFATPYDADYEVPYEAPYDTEYEMPYESPYETEFAASYEVECGPPYDADCPLPHETGYGPAHETGYMTVQPHRTNEAAESYQARGGQSGHSARQPQHQSQQYVAPGPVDSESREEAHTAVYGIRIPTAMSQAPARHNTPHYGTPTLHTSPKPTPTGPFAAPQLQEPVMGPIAASQPQLHAAPQLQSPFKPYASQASTPHASPAPFSSQSLPQQPGTPQVHRPPQPHAFPSSLQPPAPAHAYASAQPGVPPQSPAPGHAYASAQSSIPLQPPTPGQAYPPMGPGGSPQQPAPPQRHPPPQHFASRGGGSPPPRQQAFTATAPAALPEVEAQALFDFGSPPLSRRFPAAELYPPDLRPMLTRHRLRRSRHRTAASMLTGAALALGVSALRPGAALTSGSGASVRGPTVPSAQARAPGMPTSIGLSDPRPRS